MKNFEEIMDEIHDNIAKVVEETKNLDEYEAADKIADAMIEGFEKLDEAEQAARQTVA